MIKWVALAALLAGLTAMSLPVQDGAGAAGGEGEVHAADDGHAVPQSEMISTLFLHLQPHAVGALWFGGSKGFGLVDPYPTDASGQPLALDGHGDPVPFHSGAELVEFYADVFGGGWGFLLLNINTAQWMAAALVFVVFLLIARAARKHGNNTPRGATYNLIESIVLFVRDEMVYKTMGKEIGRRFVPLFLTQFFFILFMNLLGLVPLPGVLGKFGGTATASLSITAGLAVSTLVWIHMSGMREHGVFVHWKNFIPHGVPVGILPVIIPVEILGMIIKPVVLAVRLFGNIFGGHLVMLTFFGLAYMSASWVIAGPVLLLAIAISCLELFVAFLQAYIFTYLSIIFVGAAVHPDH